MKKNNVRIAIIGAGPAGIACGIQLFRQGYSPLIFEKEEVGGLLRNANLVENYPGFPGGVSGSKLCSLFEKQLLAYSPNIIKQNVTNISYIEDQFIVNADDDVYYFKILIVASGTLPKKTNDFFVSQNAKDRIYYDLTKLKKIKNKSFAIVGAGDAAFDYALNMSKNNTVIILNRSDKINCLELLFERASKNINIQYIENTSIESVDMENDRLKISIINKNYLLSDYLLIAIGRNANISFLNESIINNKDELEKDGFLYFIGDIKNGKFRQTSISIGHGVKTAMEISEKINYI